MAFRRKNPLPKSTILFYAGQGLLPAPKKTSRNMAYYDVDDVGMGRMFFEELRLGIRAEELAYYAELGEKIVDREMALHNKITSALPYPEDAATTTQMVKNARMCRAYVIDRLFQHRVAAMKNLKDQPQPHAEEREPWLD